MVAARGREVGLVDLFPVGAVTVGQRGAELAELGAMARSAAGSTASPTTAAHPRGPAAAPGAGVHPGLRRRDRRPRRGRLADRRRPDARGRGLGHARAGRLAGRRRGDGGRPRPAAGRADRRAPAPLPRLHRRRGRAGQGGQGPRGAGHRRGRPPPLHPDRRGRPLLRPGVQGQPAPAREGRRRGRPPGAGRRHPRRHRHRPRPPRPRGQGGRVGQRPAGHARPGDRPGRDPDRAGRARLPRPGDRGRAAHRRAGPLPAPRARRPGRAWGAGQPGRARPGRHLDGRPGQAGQPGPQHPLPRPRAARPGRPHPAARRLHRPRRAGA